MLCVSLVGRLCRPFLILLVCGKIISQSAAQCIRVQKPWNGEIVGSCQNYVGAQCSFTCRSPYVIKGSQTRTCQADGTWSGQPTYCDLEHCPNCDNINNNVRCSAIIAPSGATVQGNCNTGEIGSSCIFRCNNNYIIDGQPVLVCLPSGAWSGQPPICRGSRIGEQIDGRGWCPTLNAPPGGRLVGSCSAAQVADTCQLVCISGYRPSDTRILVCQQNRAWSDTLPTCIGGSNTQCQNVAVNQGTASGSCSPGVPGQTCTITCYSGYTLTGPGTLTCQANGSWSGNIPSCTARTCPALLVSINGSTSGSCNPGTMGQTCNFTCNSDYQLIGESSLLCDNHGKWSSNLPDCVAATCPAISPPANGGVSNSCSQATSGQTCIFTCQSGFTLVGQPVLVCQSGRWSGQAPTCVQNSCPALAVPSNGATSGSCSRASVGQTCYFSCNSGYRLAGQQSLVCQSGGRWSGNAPICAPIACPALIAPANGAASGSCSQATPGQSCTFSCQSGYSLTGQSVSICQASGSWSSPTPTCTPSPTCPSLTPPANGAQSGSCGPATAGQTCTFSCQSGYMLVGQSTAVCQAGGRWSTTPPICRAPTCPVLNPPTNGGLSGSCGPATAGQTCTFSCQTGYTLSSTAPLVCQPGGTWSSSAPICNRTPTTCPNLFGPENGYIIGTCAPGQAGQTCTFGCQSNYVLRGTGTLTCQSSGTWSALPPSCESGESEAGCPSLTAPSNGEFVECDNRRGGRCVVVCQRGFIRSGSRVRTCLASGVWSGFAPICGRKTVYGYRVVPLWSLIFG